MAMKIEIELTPGTARRIGRVAVTLAILGIGAAVYASQTHFSSGQALTAASLNNNFDELYAAAAKPTITRGGKSISVGGAFCGASSPVIGGMLGGYAGAKATCETTCGSATAHMCDVTEVIRSQALGLTFAGVGDNQLAWVTPFYNSGTAIQDCAGWTSVNAQGLGWSPSLRAEFSCGQAHSIACCD
jgi:hypothetical protein